MRIYMPLLVSLFFLANWMNGAAQEQIGLRIENYAGVNSVLLNPSANITSKFKWDVNLIAAGAFVENDYGYIRNANLRDILRQTDNIRLVSEFENESQIPSDALVVDYFKDNKSKFAFVSTFVTGPSFMINMANGHSFGLFTNIRSAISAPNIPAQLNYDEFDDTPLFDPIDIPAFNLAGMSWSEIGFNYARKQTTYNGAVGFGINLKILNGYEAFYFSNSTRIQLTQLPSDTITFTGARLEYGLTLSNSGGEDFSLSKNGIGIGIDLGFTYTIDLDDDNYLWRFGASLLDIGRIRFKQNAESHVVDTDNISTIPSGDYKGIDNVEDFIHRFSENTLNDPNASLEGTDFGVWLPGAISLQADYALLPYIYLNGLLVQRVPIGEIAVKRGNLLAFTPRFEHRWFSAALPISVYNYRDLRLGAALRLAFITIGSENLGSILGNGNFTGTDLYFALRINPFELGFNNVVGWNSNKGKNVKCYEF